MNSRFFFIAFTIKQSLVLVCKCLSHSLDYELHEYNVFIYLSHTYIPVSSKDSINIYWVNDWDNRQGCEDMFTSNLRPSGSLTSLNISSHGPLFLPMVLWGPEGHAHTLVPFCTPLVGIILGIWNKRITRWMDGEMHEWSIWSCDEKALPLSFFFLTPLPLGSEGLWAPPVCLRLNFFCYFKLGEKNEYEHLLLSVDWYVLDALLGTTGVKNNFKTSFSPLQELINRQGDRSIIHEEVNNKGWSQ